LSLPAPRSGASSVPRHCRPPLTTFVINEATLELYRLPHHVGKLVLHGVS